MATLEEVGFDPFAPPKASSPADFAATYAPVAERIGSRLGVDPKVILGQLGLETGWGKSVIPGTNNLGNIKDFSGSGTAATDNMTGSRDKYRTYKSVDDFANDYASLIERKYPKAIGAGADPGKFTAGLQGYAEDPRYADKVAQATRMVSAAPGPVMNALGKAAGAIIPSANAAQPKLQEVDFDPFAAPPAAAAQSGGATGSFDAPPPSRMDRLIKGIRDPIDGGAQLLTNALPAGVVKAGDNLNNWLADKTGLVARLPEGGVDQHIKQQEAAYQAARGPDAGFDGYRVLGNVVSPANLAIASRAPLAASLAGRVGVGAMSGAASSALNPTLGDDFWADKAKQVGTGAAFGGATPVVTGAIGRVISPNASTNANLNLLRSEGVNPTIGQTLGGWANRLEEKATSIPIMGDMISGARENAREQFNKAAINRAVAPIGETVDEIGQVGIKKAGDLLSKSYDDAINAVKVVKFDPQFSADVGQLRSMAQNMQPAMAQRFNATIDDVLQPKIVANGSMLGATYKQIDSKLGQEAAKFSKASDPFQQELGDAYKQLQSLLKQQAARSNPDFAKTIAQTDAGWANLVRLEGAGKAAMNTEGVFTPGQLNGAIRQADQSVRDRASARGTALMQDLGNAGQQVIGNKVPNSGTADRWMLGVGGLGAGMINPLIPAGLLGGAAMYASPVQSLLRGAVANRPEAAQAVSNSLLQASPRLLPGAAQVGLGLLN